MNPAVDPDGECADEQASFGLMVEEDPVEVIEDDEDWMVVSGEEADLGLIVEVLEDVMFERNEDREERFTDILMVDRLRSSRDCWMSWICSGSSA